MRRLADAVLDTHGTWLGTTYVAVNIAQPSLPCRTRVASPASKVGGRRRGPHPGVFMPPCLHLAMTLLLCRLPSTLTAGLSAASAGDADPFPWVFQCLSWRWLRPLYEFVEGDSLAAFNGLGAPAQEQTTTVMMKVGGWYWRWMYVLQGLCCSADRRAGSPGWSVGTAACPVLAHLAAPACKRCAGITALSPLIGGLGPSSAG